MIRQHATLSSACASGQTAIVELLASLDETDLDELGDDGTSPLCAACTWDFEPIVRVLIEAGCDVNVRNRGTQSTALHVASSQENGKIVHMLLQAGADPTLEDVFGRSSCDFASPSAGIWPLFAARNLSRTPKAELLRKGLIRKVAQPIEAPGSGAAAAATAPLPAGAVPFYSRPGSAYVASDPNRPVRASTARLPSLSEGGVDPLDGCVDPLDGLPDADEPEQTVTAAGLDAAARRVREGGHGVAADVRDAATTWPASAAKPASEPAFSLWRS